MKGNPPFCYAEFKSGYLPDQFAMCSIDGIYQVRHAPAVFMDVVGHDCHNIGVVAAHDQIAFIV